MFDLFIIIFKWRIAYFKMFFGCLLQYVDDNLAVMSIGFLLSSPDDAVIWRGPKKNGVWAGVCAIFFPIYN